MGTEFEADGGLIPSTVGTLGGVSPGGGWRVGADEAAAGQLVPMIAGTLNANGKAAGSATQQDAENDLLVCEPMTFNLRGRDGGAQLEVDPDALVNMRAANGGSSRSYVAAFGGNDTSGPRDIATCLNAKGGAGRMDFESETLIVHTLTGGGFDASEDGTGRGTPIIPLRASGAANANGSGIGLPGDPSLTLDCDGSAAIAFHARQDPDTSGDVTHPLDTDGQSIGIAFDTTQITSGENRCNPQAGGPCHPLSSTAHPPAYATVYEVRRLTPRECEKLMGVPEDYTLIPYGQKVNPKKISDDWMAYLLRGNPKGLTREDVAALAADGPRYKALGNGFAVPEIRWIGERIEAADKARGKS